MVLSLGQMSVLIDFDTCVDPVEFSFDWLIFKSAFLLFINSWVNLS